MRKVKIKNMAVEFAESNFTLYCPMSFNAPEGHDYCFTGCAWFRITEEHKYKTVSNSRIIKNCYCGDKLIGELVNETS